LLILKGRRKIQARDLFGKPERRRQPYLSASLRRVDNVTFSHRLERYQHLHDVFPKGMHYMLPTETHFLFEEIRSAYVSGLSVAVVLLTQAFIEHYYQLCLSHTKHSDAAERGLAAIIRCLKKNQLEHEIILDRIEALRLVRNPFTHLKNFEHPHTLSQRALATQRNPLALLEQDAKNSLDALFAIIQHSKFGS
jgi:hypothetical protein